MSSYIVNKHKCKHILAFVLHQHIKSERMTDLNEPDSRPLAGGRGFLDDRYKLDVNEYLSTIYIPNPQRIYAGSDSGRCFPNLLNNVSSASKFSIFSGEVWSRSCRSIYPHLLIF